MTILRGAALAVAIAGCAMPVEHLRLDPPVHRRVGNLRLRIEHVAVSPDVFELGSDEASRAVVGVRVRNVGTEPALVDPGEWLLRLEDPGEPGPTEAIPAVASGEGPPPPSVSDGDRMRPIRLAPNEVRALWAAFGPLPVEATGERRRVVLDVRADGVLLYDPGVSRPRWRARARSFGLALRMSIAVVSEVPRGEGLNDGVGVLGFPQLGLVWADGDFSANLALGPSFIFVDKELDLGLSGGLHVGWTFVDFDRDLIGLGVFAGVDMLSSDQKNVSAVGPALGLQMTTRTVRISNGPFPVLRDRTRLGVVMSLGYVHYAVRGRFSPGFLYLLDLPFIAG